MSEEEYLKQLFQLCPKLRTLTFYFDDQGRLMLPHLNGVDWMKAFVGTMDLNNEVDKSFMVEVDWSETELNNLLVGLDFLASRTFKGKSRQWLFITKEWNKALTIKEVLTKETHPFPYFDFHKKVQEVFIKNPDLYTISYVPRYGAVRVASFTDPEEVQIKANWLPVPQEYPPFISNVEVLLELMDELSKTKIPYGGSFFNSRYYI